MVKYRGEWGKTERLTLEGDNMKSEGEKGTGLEQGLVDLRL